MTVQDIKDNVTEAEETAEAVRPFDDRVQIPHPPYEPVWLYGPGVDYDSRH